MDKLTHLSLTNAIKELDALHKLALSGNYSQEEIADWIQEISWHLANIFQRRRYSSDEFQCRLIKFLQDVKKGEASPGQIKSLYPDLREGLIEDDE